MTIMLNKKDIIPFSIVFIIIGFCLYKGFVLNKCTSENSLKTEAVLTNKDSDAQGTPVFTYEYMISGTMYHSTKNQHEYFKIQIGDTIIIDVCKFDLEFSNVDWYNKEMEKYLRH
jgi:hypothetical protein